MNGDTKEGIGSQELREEFIVLPKWTQHISTVPVATLQGPDAPGSCYRYLEVLPRYPVLQEAPAPHSSSFHVFIQFFRDWDGWLPLLLQVLIFQRDCLHNESGLYSIHDRSKVMDGIIPVVPRISDREQLPETRQTTLEVERVLSHNSRIPSPSNYSNATPIMI